MSDTNSNAYRQEAAEKRAQIAQLADQANRLDEQADDLEGIHHSDAHIEPEVETPKAKLFSKN